MDDLNIINNIFCNVNHWISHAETKNATLLGYNIAIIAALLQLDFLGIHFIVAVFIIAIIPPLISFFPQVKPISRKQRKLLDTDNLLFYDDISKYNSKEYLEKVTKNYKLSSDSKLLSDYCEEIVVNAKIAVWKYTLFKAGLVLSLISSFAMLLLYIYNNSC